MTTIDEWLNKNGLDKYRGTFADAEIDLATLPHLTDGDLKELGLPLGPRRRALAAIDKLRGPGGGTPGPATSSLAGADRRQLTVMFVDLVGSTALSVDLDPEDMGDVIGDFQKAVSGEVAQVGGYVAKFMGDGVLAYFGWPQAHEDAAERAVRAGLCIATAVASQRAANKPLAVRIGIATGLVVVGDLVGEGSAQEELVVGTTPNLAARLQAIAKPGCIVVSETTRQVLPSTFELDDLGPQSFKGLSEDAHAFRVIREHSAESRFAARSNFATASLVGRFDEIDFLQGCWASAVAGAGRLLLVDGEAGIGKSHFVQAFADALSEPHNKITWQCSPYHVESPLWPAVQQIARSAGIDDTDNQTATLEKLARYLSHSGVTETKKLSHFAGLLGMGTDEAYGPVSTSPAQRRAGALSAVVELLRRLAFDAPLFWLIEDAHWSDPSTLDLIGLALETIAEQRILVVVTSRPDFKPTFATHASARRLSLNKLERPQVGEIVQRVSHEKALPDALVDEIALRTDGVPLFVEEMTKTVLESGLLRESDSGWVVTVPFAQLPIPTTLQDTLMARIDRLGSFKEIAQVAAIIGRTFDRSILARLTTASSDTLTKALNKLVEIGLISRKSGDQDRIFQFKHALVRDVAYESLLRRHRQSLHLKLLEIFESGDGSLPEVLALHAEAGGDVARAISWRCEAGSKAVARGNFEEADFHLDAAEAMLGQIEDAIGRKQFAATVSIARAIASLVRRGHGHTGTSLLFQQSAELTQEAEDPVQVVAASYGVWAYHYVHGDVLHALDVARALADTGKQRDDAIISGLASSLIGIALTMAGNLPDARRTMCAAQSVIPPSAAERLRAQVGFDLAQSTTCYLAWAELVSGLATQSHKRAAEVQGSLEAEEEVNSRAFKLSHAGALAAEYGDFARMGQVGEEMLFMGKAHGLKFWDAFGHAFAGWHLLDQDQPAAAVEHLEISYVEMRLRGGGLLGALIPGLLAEAKARCGDSAALDIIADTQAEAGSTGRHFGQAETLRRHGRILNCLRPPSPDAAEHQFRQALDTAHKQGAILWEIRAGLDLANHLVTQDRRAECQRLLEPILRRWQDEIQPVDVVRARSLLDTICA